MTLYQRKPTPPVEAVQWTGENFEEVKEFVGGEATRDTDGVLWFDMGVLGTETVLRIGGVIVKRDGIVRETFSHVERFEATYEPVEDGPDREATVERLWNEAGEVGYLLLDESSEWSYDPNRRRLVVHEVDAALHEQLTEIGEPVAGGDTEGADA